MLYFLTVVFGLIIAFLMFFQLHNEKRIQQKQIKRLFENLIINVYCGGNTAPNTTFAPDIKYNIVSTSITLGKFTDGQQHQIDLPITTTDNSLAGTAAVITTIPSKSGLDISISCVEQPYIIVRHANPTEGQCEFEYNLNKEQKKLQVKTIRGERRDPRVAENYTFPFEPYFLGTSLNGKALGFNPISFEIPVKPGDEILLGNTLLKIESCLEG